MHILFRGGYALLDKKLKMFHAKSLGFESSNLVAVIPRYEIWKVARTKSNGHMTSQLAQIIFEQIISTNPIRHP